MERPVGLDRPTSQAVNKNESSILLTRRIGTFDQEDEKIFCIQHGNSDYSEYNLGIELASVGLLSFLYKLTVSLRICPLCDYRSYISVLTIVGTN